MKLFSLAAFVALASSAVAEDLLFVNTLVGLEKQEAIALGYTTKVVTDAQWRAMTTADFAAFKAIIIGDDFGSSDLTQIQFLTDTKNTWGPAVQGNIIVHGADQSNHGKTVLIDNSIKFAASGKSLAGAQTTGFYFALSQYYDSIAVANVDALGYFGTFEVRGDLSCYDEVHIVASSPSIATLTDAYLSNWGCSVHEAFSAYPSTGVNGFQAIAIADGVVTPGTQQFAGGHSGLPYIITRGATPDGCGNGIYEPGLLEECDDGNVANGDGCSASCKCESGKPKGDGTCLPANGTTPIGTGTGPSGYVPVPSGSTPKPSGYTNSRYVKPVVQECRRSIDNLQQLSIYTYLPTTTPPYPITTVTSGPPAVSCIGVEIIVSVTVVESCSTVAPGSTVTYTTTSACATYQQPIYNTPIPTMPCYVCALSSQGIPTKSIGFITATTTYCPACTGTPSPATIYACPTCSGITLTATCPWATTPPFSAALYTTYAPMTEHSTTTIAGGATSTGKILTVPTGTSTASVVPTGPVQFTGGAGAGKNAGGLVALAGAVVALVL
ncbi:hypothetical protein LSUE1_G002104 [Lachnellula suecica]|uniref:Uncharacterized protein n=1 Tax=Lachnellula suecica TaxID=602035 RepID=A0A8T9CET0_9HELO|nr:hypothetical protein LSUE1_G002104 [Lachnellula suecica]